MGIVETASFITAFLAGGAALFAPCCIGVLLPSYLASTFQTRTKVFLMTFVYYLGLLTIFLPIGLGFAGLGELFRSYHTLIFAVGGLFMVLLGASLLLGRAIMLPIHVKQRLDSKHSIWSLYVLGIFSGIATSCCAPVLAGVMALTILPGSWGLGIVYSLAFVTGMVLPLFIIAALVDKTKALSRISLLKRQISYRIFRQNISVHLSHFVAGLLYVAVGGLVLYFGSRGPEALSNTYQLNINLWTADATNYVTNITNYIPQSAWMIIFIIMFGLIAYVAYRQSRNKSDEIVEKDGENV